MHRGRPDVGLLAALLLAGACGGAPATSPVPTRHTSPQTVTVTPRTAPTAADLVADPSSSLSSVVVLRAGARHSVSALWTCNQDEGPCPRRAAIVRSDDGFATAEYFPGGRRSMRAHLALDRPAGAGRLASCVSVAGGTSLCDRARDGRSIAWTRDGGRTWQRAAVDLAPLLPWPVPSLRPGILAVAGGGDGATLFPFEKVAVSRDGGATWRTYVVSRPGGLLAYSSGFAVDSGGRVIALLDNWSDDRAGKPSARPHGLYVSNGSDWSAYRPLGTRFRPALTPAPRGWSPLVSLGSSAAPDPVLWVTTWDDRLYVSVDDGATFREIPAR